MIKLFKLLSGDLLIAKLLKTENNIVTLENPIFIITSQQGTMFYDLISAVSNDKTVEINNDQITFTLTPNETFTSKYQETTSNLVMPTKKLVV